jgi:hypothetical protein
VLLMDISVLYLALCVGVAVQRVKWSPEAQAAFARRRQPVVFEGSPLIHWNSITPASLAADPRTSIEFEAFSTREPQGEGQGAFYSMYDGFEMSTAFVNASRFSTLALRHSLDQISVMGRHTVTDFWETTPAGKARFAKLALWNFGGSLDKHVSPCSFHVSDFDVACDPNNEEHDIWLHAGMSTSWCHYDYQHNFYGLLFGSRQFELWPPEVAASLQLYPVLHPRHRQARAQRRADGSLRLSHSELSRIQKLDAVLSQGEVLYIPPHWLHSASASAAAPASSAAVEEAAGAGRTAEAASASGSIALSVCSESTEERTMNGLSAAPLPFDSQWLVAHEVEAAAGAAPIRAALALQAYIGLVCRAVGTSATAVARSLLRERYEGLLAMPREHGEQGGGGEQDMGGDTQVCESEAEGGSESESERGLQGHGRDQYLVFRPSLCEHKRPQTSTGTRLEHGSCCWDAMVGAGEGLGFDWANFLADVSKRLADADAGTGGRSNHNHSSSVHARLLLRVEDPPARLLLLRNLVEEWAAYLVGVEHVFPFLRCIARQPSGAVGDEEEGGGGLGSWLLREGAGAGTGGCPVLCATALFGYR